MWVIYPALLKMFWIISYLLYQKSNLIICTFLVMRYAQHWWQHHFYNLTSYSKLLSIFLPLFLIVSMIQTTYKGKSSFQTHSDFLQWESFLQKQLASLPASSALRRGFQTCQHWKQIFMEIIGKRAKIEHGIDRNQLW